MGKRNSDVDAYLARAERWQRESKKLRSILLSCDLDEELKWAKPCYGYQGSNLAIIQGFKRHCSLLFFRGSLLEDKHGLLVPPGPNSRVGMRVDFTGLGEVKEREAALRDYVEQAKALIESGKKVELDERPEPEPPDELAKKLEEDPELEEAFRALTPGRQRGWILHFSSAKQSKTRASRIEKARSKILAGKGLNDR